MAPERRERGSGGVTHIGGDRYLLRIRTADGKRRGKTIQAASPEAAHDALDKLMDALKAEGQASPGGITVRGWLEEWLRRQARSRSYVAYEQRVRCYLYTAPFANDLLVNLRPRDVRDHVRRLLETLEPSTVGATLTHLRTALREAVEDELIETNPALEVRVPKTAWAGKKDARKPLPPDAVPRLFACEKIKTRDKAVLGVALYGGLRVGEVFAMPLANVIRQGDELLLDVQFGGHNAPTKGGAGLVPVVGEARVWLERWLAMVPKRGPKNTDGMLFPGRDGGRHSKGHGAEWLRYRLKLAGLPTEHRFHDLRHTAAEALENGWYGPPQAREIVQAVLRHSSLAQTQAYTGGAVTAMRRSMRALDAKPEAKDPAPAAPSDRDQVGISASPEAIESAENLAKNEQTARRRPCLSQAPVIPQCSGGSDPEAIPTIPSDLSAAYVGIRTATEQLLACGGAATRNDVFLWQARVLALDPTPFAKVRALDDGPFRMREALRLAREVLTWFEAQMPAGKRRRGRGGGR
jgi:integrase/recombinase XerD